MGRQPIADELLVEAGLVLALLVGIAGPEARGVGGEYLVGQDDGVTETAELELRVGDDNTALGRVVGGGGVYLQRQVAQGRGILFPEDFRKALEGDVLVVVANLGLGGGGEDGLGQLRGVHEALGQLYAADGALAVVLLQAATSQIPAHDALGGEHVGLLH